MHNLALGPDFLNLEVCIGAPGLTVSNIDKQHQGQEPNTDKG